MWKTHDRAAFASGTVEVNMFPQATSQKERERSNANALRQKQRSYAQPCN